VEKERQLLGEIERQFTDAFCQGLLSTLGAIPPFVGGIPPKGVEVNASSDQFTSQFMSLHRQKRVTR